MNIPGKLREDLKRIYGNRDPLDCIENIQVEEGPCGCELRMTLRVPSSCERYLPGVYLRYDGAPYNLEKWAREQAMLCGLGVREAPEPKAVPIEVPEKVFFNGTHTTLVWPDGEKTVVGTAPGEQFDEYTGFCAAMVKKLFGSSREAQKFMDKVKIVQKKKAKKKPVEVDQ